MPRPAAGGQLEHEVRRPPVVEPGERLVTDHGPVPQVDDRLEERPERRRVDHRLDGGPVGRLPAPRAETRPDQGPDDRPERDQRRQAFDE